MAIVLLVPINSRAARLVARRHPSGRKRQVGRWDRAHNLRVGIIGATFVLYVVGVT